jgi:hypothetical protein
VRVVGVRYRGYGGQCERRWRKALSCPGVGRGRLEMRRSYFLFREGGRRNPECWGRRGGRRHVDLRAGGKSILILRREEMVG